MERFPTELIYVLIFAAIVLFQYAMKRFAPQEQPESAQDEQFARDEEETQPAPMPVPAAGVAVGHFGRSAAPSVSPALSRRRFSRRSLLGSRREVQNAIVIATILGPCRAYEPHDIK
jgi:hypothetical protein